MQKVCDNAPRMTRDGKMKMDKSKQIERKIEKIKHQIANYRKCKEFTQQWVTLAIELCKIRVENQPSE